MEFFVLEKSLGLQNVRSKNLISDLNVLCRKIAQSIDGDNLSLYLENIKNLKSDLYGDCAESMWEQVYLTAFAKKEANPIGAIRLVRMADARLPRVSAWRDKAFLLLKKL
jgi:hypothetical protein